MTTPSLRFKSWLEGGQVKEVADKWFRPNGSPKFLAMTQTMIADTMKAYGLGLEEAARLFERALLYYKDEHVVGGPDAYWSLVMRMKNEMAGADAIVGSCRPTADYQVWGACSDLKGRKRGKKQRKKGKRA